MKSISEIIRSRLSAHIAATDQSLRSIARDTSIDVGQLSRFINSTGDPAIPRDKLGQVALDSLAAYLGLTMTPIKPKPKSKPSKGKLKP